MNKCKHCGKECKNTNSLRNHERLCSKNPSKQDSSFKFFREQLKNGDKVTWNKGLTKLTNSSIAECAAKLSGKTYTNRKLPSAELKIRISESMKKAHADGRAHNIGSSRWNNEPSYPEKFFAKVIANEFEDKDFVQEYPFGRYSLDFAWVHLKKVIEIDGDQHERFEKQKTSDARKDKALVDAGWQVLRVKWREMYSDTKVQIANCKQFLIAK